MSRPKGVTKKDWEWINETVDNHKFIRAESTRDRVKLLLLAAMLRVTKSKKQ